MVEPLSLLQLLQAVQYALNRIPRTNLRGCPHGITDTYMLASYVDVYVAHGEENKEERDY